MFTFLNDRQCGFYHKSNLDIRDDEIIKKGLKLVIEKSNVNDYNFPYDTLISYVKDQIFRVQQREDKIEQTRFYLDLLLKFGYFYEEKFNATF